MHNTFCKAERLNSKLIIDKLFAGGNGSFAVFPLRVVFMKTEKKDSSQANGAQEPPVSILISVPKKRFIHAVDRNRVKRIVRETYRRNKHILWDNLADKDYNLAIGFICITDTLPEYKKTEKSMLRALNKISQNLL